MILSLSNDSMNWLYNIDRQALIHLCRSLYIESPGAQSSKDIIANLLSKYSLYNIFSFKVFISQYDVVIFELNDNGKYSYQDFIIPTLTINNYERVSHLDNFILVKTKENVFFIGKFIEKLNLN